MGVEATHTGKVNFHVNSSYFLGGATARHSAFCGHRCTVDGPCSNGTGLQRSWQFQSTESVAQDA
jgi:hypothetical protein